ncbi:MAG: mechanosensitive ion channel family protein [Bryobacteraceae bacterium]
MKFGWSLLGALAVWIIGRWLIKFAIGLLSRALTQQKIDGTIVRYASNTLSVVLTVMLVLGILGMLGVETTSFAALLAGAGLAIGAAWSGLLANFAAGAFLVILRPFKTGDFISAGGITGTVEEIGLFVTTINTPDNVRTYVGNNKIFSDNLQNFSANPFRRVDITAPLAHAVEPKQAMAEIAQRVAAIPNVLSNPAPDVEIASYAAYGYVLAVRPYCHTDHYWQVYFDTQRALQDVLRSGGFPEPVVRPETSQA